MVAPGGQSPWPPRGSGLLVAVVALSVVALVVHGAIALMLLDGTAHRGAPASADPTATPSQTATNGLRPADSPHLDTPV